MENEELEELIEDLNSKSLSQINLEINLEAIEEYPSEEELKEYLEAESFFINGFSNTNIIQKINMRDLFYRFEKIFG